MTALAGSLALAPAQVAHASMFAGETLDTIADVITWVVLIVAPIVAIAVFLVIHILPEKIAERNHHPQAKAIQCLCILSLFFGGLLWPLAWLWTYTKPVLHDLAYKRDARTGEGSIAASGSTAVTSVASAGDRDHGRAALEREAAELRQRVAQLEQRLASSPPGSGKES